MPPKRWENFYQTTQWSLPWKPQIQSQPVKYFKLSPVKCVLYVQLVDGGSRSYEWKWWKCVNNFVFLLQEVLGMSKEEFLELPTWKQTNIKKAVGLFWLLAYRLMKRGMTNHSQSVSLSIFMMDKPWTSRESRRRVFFSFTMQMTTRELNFITRSFDTYIYK